MSAELTRPFSCIRDEVAAWFSEMGVEKADACINAKRPKVHLDGLPLVAAVPVARAAKVRSPIKLSGQIFHLPVIAVDFLRAYSCVVS